MNILQLTGLEFLRLTTEVFEARRNTVKYQVQLKDWVQSVYPFN